MLIFLPSLPGRGTRPRHRLLERDSRVWSLVGLRTLLSRLPRSEQFNDVIRRDSDVRDSRFEHAGNTVDYAADRCDLFALVVGLGWDRVKVTEQFVRAIHEVDIHARTTLISKKETVSLGFPKVP